MIPFVLPLTACTHDLPSAEPEVPVQTDDQEPPEQRPTQGKDPPEPPCVPAAAIVVNELSSSNRGLLVDGHGETPDWLELYNTETVPVALGGWTLSDEEDEPGKWVFPPFTIEPGAYQVIYASGEDRASVVTWDTRLDQGDNWRYLPVDQATDPGWFLPGYDDSSWATGPSGFGADDDDDATEVLTSTVYLRTTVDLTVDDLSDLTALLLHIDYDDAFVAWLNGIEVARDGIGTPGIPPAWDELPRYAHEAQMYQGGEPMLFDLGFAVSLLTDGPNTLAIEVHNTSGSDDLSVIPLLTLGFDTDRPARTSAVLALSTQLVANFALGADGEHVWLSDPAGCGVDDLSPGKMFTDQSFGHQPDGNGDTGYFMEPTPGAPNTTESRPGFAATPVFDPPSGHHPGGTGVTVTGGPGAAIHVAWDGREPTEADPLADGPLNTGNDGEAVVVRARAWEDGLWPSRIATATYLLRDPGTLPIVSLVTEPSNLWDEETGIYTFGAEFDTDDPFRGANFWEDWERPVHFEEWEPDGVIATSVDAGISIYGGYSRAHDQKSLLIQLRSGYGDATVEHDVFPGLGVTSFGRLVLRAAGTDWFGCYQSGCSEGAHLRDPLMHHLTSGSGIDALAYRPSEVYLNGEYWGIYDLRERADLDYVAAHYGVEDIDLLESQGDVIEGDALHYQSMMAYLRSADLTDPASYTEIEAMIDVDELTSYLVFETWFDNTDWPENNIRFWRPRTPDGRWRWLLYDTDFGLGRWGQSPDRDTLAHAFEPDLSTTELFRLLLQAPGFRNLFLNRYADFLNTTLRPEVTRDALHVFASGIATEIPRQEDRWGRWTDGTVTYTLEPGIWDEEIEWIDEWLGERPDYARTNLVNHFGLAGTWMLDLAVDPPGSGSFALTAVEVEAPFTGVYFRGVPMTVTAIPAAGFTFVGWSDPTLPADPELTLDGGGYEGLVAVFQ